MKPIGPQTQYATAMEENWVTGSVQPQKAFVLFQKSSLTRARLNHGEILLLHFERWTTLRAQKDFKTDTSWAGSREEGADGDNKLWCRQFLANQPGFDKPSDLVNYMTVVWSTVTMTSWPDFKQVVQDLQTTPTRLTSES